MNKLSQFESFVYSSHFHVLGVTETWLSSEISNHEILFLGSLFFILIGQLGVGVC